LKSAAAEMPGAFLLAVLGMGIAYQGYTIAGVEDET
jgi:hypothetical protein